MASLAGSEWPLGLVQGIPAGLGDDGSDLSDRLSAGPNSEGVHGSHPAEISFNEDSRALPFEDGSEAARPSTCQDFPGLTSVKGFVDTEAAAEMTSPLAVEYSPRGVPTTAMAGDPHRQSEAAVFTRPCRQHAGGIYR